MGVNSILTQNFKILTWKPIFFNYLFIKYLPSCFPFSSILIKLVIGNGCCWWSFGDWGCLMNEIEKILRDRVKLLPVIPLNAPAFLRNSVIFHRCVFLFVHNGLHNHRCSFSIGDWVPLHPLISFWLLKTSHHRWNLVVRIYCLCHRIGWISWEICLVFPQEQTGICFDLHMLRVLSWPPAWRRFRFLYWTSLACIWRTNHQHWALFLWRARDKLDILIF